MQPDTVFRGLDYVYKGPLLGLVLILLAALLAIAAWYMLVAHPRGVAERAAERQMDREHVAHLLKTKGEEAAEDAERDRELAKAHGEVIVSRVEGKVDRLHGRVEEVHGAIRRVAESLKVPVLVFLLLASLGGFLAYARRVADADRRCDPPCPAGQRCVKGACKSKDVLTNKPTSFAGSPDGTEYGVILPETLDPWQDRGG